MAKKGKKTEKQSKTAGKGASLPGDSNFAAKQNPAEPDTPAKPGAEQPLHPDSQISASDNRQSTIDLRQLALVVVAAVVAFAGAVGNGFVFFDDDKAILYNPALQNPSIGKFFSGQNLGMYAPLSWMAYWLGSSISGQEAWGHHLLGIVLHALNAALAYLFVNRLTGRPYPALFAAVLFAVHPVQTEAVAWAAALSTVLFSFFYLLSLNLYVLIDAAQPVRNRTLLYAGALVFFLAACLSKSAAVTLPLVLIAIDIFREKKLIGKFWLSKIPFLLISLLFGLYTFSTRADEGHDIEQASSVFSALDRVWMVAQTIWFYPVKILFPFGFSIAYPFVKTNGAWPWTYYAALPALGAAAWLAWRFRRGQPERLLALALYLLPLSVMLPFRTVGSFELRSDRYVYLSCIGLFLLGGLLLERVRQDVRWALLAVAGAGLAFLSMQQTGVWKNGVTLFENCVEKTPNAALCQCNLAYNELLSLEFPRAIEHYSNTLRLDSSYIEAYNGRGQAYLVTNKIPKALSDFNNAIRYGLSSPKLFLNQGKCLVLLGQYADAVPALDKSITLEPRSAEAYFFRGQAHAQTAAPDKALNDFEKALELKPDYIEVLELRAQMRMQGKQADEAIADLNRILEIDPQRAAARSNRGYAYFLTGQYGAALTDLDQVVAQNPQFPLAYRIRALVHEKLGHPVQAQEDLQKVQQLSVGR